MIYRAELKTIYWKSSNIFLQILSMSGWNESWILIRHDHVALDFLLLYRRRHRKKFRMPWRECVNASERTNAPHNLLI